MLFQDASWYVLEVLNLGFYMYSIQKSYLSFFSVRKVTSKNITAMVAFSMAAKTELIHSNNQNFHK